MGELLLYLRGNGHPVSTPLERLVVAFSVKSALHLFAPTGLCRTQRVAESIYSQDEINEDRKDADSFDD